MTYKSVRNVVNVVLSLILVIAYVIYARSTSAPAIEDIKGWSKLMLTFIVISIAILIVVQIIFHMFYAYRITVKENTKDEKLINRIMASSNVEDEMGKLIILKSERLEHLTVGLGFVIALITLSTGATPVVSLHIILGSFSLGSIMEGLYEIYLYESGVNRD